MIASVRTAKAKLSELLERAASGEDVIITSDGRPKARLVGVRADVLPFHVNRRLLAMRPKKNAGRPAEVLIREDRDSRD